MLGRSLNNGQLHVKRFSYNDRFQNQNLETTSQMCFKAEVACTGRLLALMIESLFVLVQYTIEFPEYIRSQLRERSVGQAAAKSINVGELEFTRT